MMAPMMGKLYCLRYPDATAGTLAPLESPRTFYLLALLQDMGQPAQTGSLTA